MVTSHYIPTDQFVRVECDLKDDAGNLLYPGVWIEARKNLTIGERTALVDALIDLDEKGEDIRLVFVDRGTAIDDERDAIKAIPTQSDEPGVATIDPAERRRKLRELDRQGRELLREMEQSLEEIGVQRRALIVPYIRAWNLYGADETPLPPPRDGGVSVLREVFPDLMGWMILTCQNAYRLGKGLTTTIGSGGPPAPTTGPNSVGPQVRSASSSRRSRKKS